MTDINLNESNIPSIYHIYEDSTTGNEYVFNGKELILIGNSKKRNDTKIDAEEKKEREENKYRDPLDPGVEARRLRMQQIMDDKKFAQEVSNEEKMKAANKQLKNDDNDWGSGSITTGSRTEVINTLSRDIKKLIGDQVKDLKQQTYSKFNRRFVNTPYFRTGTTKIKNKNKPSLCVFLDWSASWYDSDLEAADEILAGLKEFVDNDLLSTDIWYFGGNLAKSRSNVNRSATNGYIVFEKIRELKPTNVLIVTDSDTTSQKLPSISVPGGVWLMFRNGVSQAMIKNLHGRQSTKHYNINDMSK